MLVQVLRWFPLVKEEFYRPTEFSNPLGKRIIPRRSEKSLLFGLLKGNDPKAFPCQRTSTPDGNHQLSACVPGFQMPDSLGHFAQLVAALYDRSHLSGFN
jgi:hypothetical protein